MKTKHHLRYVRGVVAALAITTLTAACGAAYRSSSLLGPQRIDDHRAVAGPARISLRFGAEWVEIAIENTGHEPIEVDWNRIMLVESDVAPHHLRELRFLREEVAVPYGAPTALRTRYSLAAQHPLARPEMPLSAPERIAPGKSRIALLYVSEHIKVEAGTTIVGPLFCHPATLHAEQQHVVGLIVPVRVGTRADVLRLDAVVAAY
jgi:hypothetical protein